jgi:hypothetical protein
VTSSSETQLRSRLKKWRVTKPSRQTRKKNLDGSQDAGVDEDEPEETSPEEPAVSSTPTPSQPPPSQASPQSNTLSIDWYETNSWVNPPQQQPPPAQSEQANLIHQSVLNSSMSFGMQELTPSWGLSSSPPESAPSGQESQTLANPPLTSVPPSMQPYSMTQLSSHPSNTINSQQLKEALQPMPVVTGVSMPRMNPSFSHHQYPMSPEACAPSPIAAHNVQWPGPTHFIEADINPSAPTWFSQPYDAFQPQTPYSFYAQNPSSPSVAGFRPMEQSIPLHDMIQNMGPPITSTSRFGVCGSPDGLKWRRAVTSHENPEAANGHARVDRQSRQRKNPIDRKKKEMLSQPVLVGVNLPQQTPAQYLPQLPSSAVHSEIYTPYSRN